MTRRPVAALASNVCGSVFGLLMIALAWTYFPPTCWMTSAYWLSAPTATILPSEPIASEDAQPPASRLTARIATRLAAGTAAAFPLQPPGMTRLPRVPLATPTLVMIMILNFGCNTDGVNRGDTRHPGQRHGHQGWYPARRAAERQLHASPASPASPVPAPRPSRRCRPDAGPMPGRPNHGNAPSSWSATTTMLHRCGSAGLPPAARTRSGASRAPPAPRPRCSRRKNRAQPPGLGRTRVGRNGSEVVPCELWERHSRRRPRGPGNRCAVVSPCAVVSAVRGGEPVRGGASRWSPCAVVSPCAEGGPGDPGARDPAGAGAGGRAGRAARLLQRPGDPRRAAAQGRDTSGWPPSTGTCRRSARRAASTRSATPAARRSTGSAARACTITT